MSLTVSTPAQICNSPLNTSKSKMLFSFPKTGRFGADIKPVCTQAFYDLPPVRSIRSPGIGYGTKFDFTKQTGSNPAPNAYNVAKGPKKYGFSFGLSREAMAITGGMFVGDKTSPGPGAYDTRETNKAVIAYTFKARTLGPDGFNTSKDAPGPGAYPTPATISPNGKYFVSKFKNSGANTFPPARSSRFGANLDLKAPGPGQYELSPLISPNGKYTASKFKSSMVRTFAHSGRNGSSGPGLHPVPGPGSYRLPSDFGFYENAPRGTVGKVAK